MFQLRSAQQRSGVQFLLPLLVLGWGTADSLLAQEPPAIAPELLIPPPDCPQIRPPVVKPVDHRPVHGSAPTPVEKPTTTTTKSTSERYPGPVVPVPYEIRTTPEPTVDLLPSLPEMVPPSPLPRLAVEEPKPTVASIPEPKTNPQVLTYLELLTENQIGLGLIGAGLLVMLLGVLLQRRKPTHVPSVKVEITQESTNQVTIHTHIETDCEQVDTTERIHMGHGQAFLIPDGRHLQQPLLKHKSEEGHPEPLTEEHRKLETILSRLEAMTSIISVHSSSASKSHRE